MSSWHLREAVVVDDVIEIDVVVPSGKAGLRLVGHPVTLRIDRDLGVEVRSPSSGRVILAGGWNLCSVVWDRQSDVDLERELCGTAVEMLDARVAAVIELFRHRWLADSWLSPRARFEAGL